MKKGNKKEVCTILVESGNLALASGSLNTTGTAFNIASGQLGVLSEDSNGSVGLGDFIPAATTSTQVNAIRVVQGTPASNNLYNADLFEVGNKALVSSDIIKKDSIYSFTSLKLRAPRYSAFSPAGLTPAIVKSNTTYKAYVTIDSVRNDRDWSDNQEVVPVTWTTGDVSTITLANRLDYLVQRFAAKANAFSRVNRTVMGNSTASNRPMLTFAVSTAGATGLAIGTITCGTVITFQKDRNKNTTSTVDSTFVANVPLVKALAELVAKSPTLTPASTIELIDLSTAGTTPDCDTFITVGLEHTQGVYFDDIEQVMTRIDVTLGDTFGATVDTKLRQDEGSGQGRKWAIDDNNRARLMTHTMQNHPFMEYFSEGITYVDPTKDYNSYILEYFDTENPLAITVTHPKKLVILVPATNTCVTVAAGETNFNASNPTIPVVVTDSATITSLNLILGAWLESARPYSNHIVGGNATPAVYFA
jgi:hypothetical protein